MLSGQAAKIIKEPEHQSLVILIIALFFKDLLCLLDMGTGNKIIPALFHHTFHVVRGNLQVELQGQNLPFVDESLVGKDL